MSRCMHRVFLQQYCTPLSIGLALDVCLAIKRLFYAKFIIRLAALLTEQSTRKYCNFLMARPCVSSKPHKSHGSENLTSLSEEILRLCLEALYRPITGSKAVLVCRLKAATHPRKGITSQPSKTQAVARANTSTRSTS